MYPVGFPSLDQDALNLKFPLWPVTMYRRCLGCEWVRLCVRQLFLSKGNFWKWTFCCKKSPIKSPSTWDSKSWKWKWRVGTGLNNEHNVHDAEEIIEVAEKCTFPLWINTVLREEKAYKPKSRDSIEKGTLKVASQPFIWTIINNIWLWKWEIPLCMYRELYETTQ